jgi:Zn-dependent alcohol dehydrogenase
MVKAAVCRAFGEPLAIEEVTLARPGPGEVAVDVKACAICHSDISYAEGAWGGPLPAVYGHEAAGVVAAVGRGVKSVKPGDHVIVTLIRSCKSCRYCKSGSEVMCEEVFPLDKQGPIRSAKGEDVWAAMRSGAFAQRMVAHESQMVKAPKSMPFATASLLSCGVITGFGAVANSAHVKAGDAVVVVGCGGVGLNVIQGAKHAGAGRIVALDLSEAKLKDARKFGATHAVNAAAGDPAAAIKKACGGRGADFAFVTVGAGPAYEQAFRYIGKNGAVVAIGMAANGVTIKVDPTIVAAWSQKMIGSKMGDSVISRDIPRLIRAWSKGELKLDELITHTFPLEKINEAIAEVKAGKARRNVIVFD